MVLLFYGKINILARRKIKWAFDLGMAETICWQFWVHGKGKVSSSSKYRNVRRIEDGCLKYAAIPRSLVILASSWWIFRLVEGEMMRCSNFTLTTTQYHSVEKTKNSSLENISWNHIYIYASKAESSWLHEIFSETFWGVKLCNFHTVDSSLHLLHLSSDFLPKK